MAWKLRGSYAETCSCELMCPCNLTFDHGATYDYCRATLAFHIRQGDVEGNYRRVWLLYALLEDYFLLRGLWYEGPQLGLAWLRTHDPPTFAAYGEALLPGAGLEAIESLVDHVLAESSGS